MRLYIGKNHDEEDKSVPVQSIFRLVGRDEDALTYALGFLLGRDPVLCAELVRLCGVKPTRSFKNGYAIYLQEVTDPGYGRRDIVIEAGKVRIVIEAKIGNAEPTAKQILKYAKDVAKWKKFTTGMVVSLTQVKLSPAVQEEVVSKLPHKPKVGFKAIQWHEVIDLVLRRGPSDGSDLSQYLFDEFVNYIRGNYDMRYYDAEIMIRNVNAINAQFFKEGWVYVTVPVNTMRAPLYFAPYFTGQGNNSGILMIARVAGVRTVKLAETQDIIEPDTEEQRKRWLQGLEMLRKHSEEYGFADESVHLFFLDEPMKFRSTPLSKTAFNATKPSKTKKMPPMIPKGFSLRFDELLPHFDPVSRG